MIAVASRADLDALRQMPRALLFLWVNWAIHARHSERHLQQFLGTWPYQSVPVYRADVSDETEIHHAIQAWLKEERVTRVSVIAGSGELLWVHNGRIVASAVHVVSVPHEQLLAISRQAFEDTGAQTIARPVETE
jgi:hypothetical protein